MSDVGGPASFQRRLVAGLADRGIEVTFDLNDEPYAVVLVINGTRHYARLRQCKKQGLRIVQRLGGINWEHRYLPVGLRGYLLAEIRNLNMRLIQTFLADHIVYQSHFVKDWWARTIGASRLPSTIIYNGVDLKQFGQRGARYESRAEVCIISVEGTQGTDLSGIATQVAQDLERKGLEVELLVFGTPWNNAHSRFAHYPFVNFKGVVPSSDLPFFYRGADFYISTDIIAACPNSVIEALACGTPVLGYRAGALPEMLNESAGRCVECHGDPWKKVPPGNQAGMVYAALELMGGRESFSEGARKLAEERYSLEMMVDAYCKVLFN